MANPINASGFTVLKTASSVLTAQANWYYIPQSDVSQYGIGDAVKIATGSDAAGIPAVQKAAGTASEYVRGVIIGCAPTPNIGTPSLVGTPLALENTYIPATKTQGYYVMVNDDPNTIYEIMDDGLTPANTVASASNKNAYYTVTNPTSPIQYSATVLTSATIGTGATLPLRILGLVQRTNPGGGNSFGANARWMVKFNFHDLNAAGVAGV